MVTEHERIVLKTDLPEYGLQSGDVGTIVHIYKDKQAYEIEFIALTGKTVAVVTIPSAQTRAIHEDEITHARTVVTTG
jgi:hypothetical protein